MISSKQMDHKWSMKSDMSCAAAKETKLLDILFLHQTESTHFLKDGITTTYCQVLPLQYQINLPCSRVITGFSSVYSSHSLIVTQT
jgi:hypothetical protein